MQTMQPVPIKVSPVGAQTDEVVPAVPVVVEGPAMASYARVATQALVEVAAAAPVGPVLPPTGARALVVHGVSCRQSMAEILWKACRLRLGTDKRVLGVCWLLEEGLRTYKWVLSVAIYFSGVVPVSGRCMRFGGQWCPVDQYEINGLMRWSEAGEYRTLSAAGW